MGGKFFLWNYALMRLRAVFSNMPFLQYSKKTLNTLQFVIIIVGGINTFWATFFITTARSEMVGDKMMTCVMVATTVSNVPIGLMVPGFLDTNVSFFIFYLFYRKMKQIYTKVDNNNNSDQKQTEKDVELVYIVRKYLILLVAAILTSYLLLAGVATTALSETFGGIDTMINTWCLVLFNKKYDNLYRKIFACCAVRRTMKTGTTKIELQLRNYIDTNNE